MDLDVHLFLAKQREKLGVHLGRHRRAKLANGTIGDLVRLDEAPRNRLSADGHRRDLSFPDEREELAVGDARKLALPLTKELPDPHPGEQRKKDEPTGPRRPRRTGRGRLGGGRVRHLIVFSNERGPDRPAPCRALGPTIRVLGNMTFRRGRQLASLRRMRLPVASLPLALALAASPARSLDLPITQSKLPNGLTVIVHEDHLLPEVATNIIYRVGSKDEQPGRTGFAHLFEHLMFMGTKRAPTKAFDEWMESAGGSNNAWTSSDFTDYHETGPSTLLPLFLWLEADRLETLGREIDQAKLDLQRDVVRNERPQTIENEPYGKVELRLPELMYPETHPYHHPVIGSPADPEAATLRDA